MEKPGENQSSGSQSNADLVKGAQAPNNELPVVPGAGQQPSILQLAGLPSYLILAAGQPVTALRGAGLNVVPLGNNLSILQTNGLHMPIIPVGAKPATSQAGVLQPQLFQLGTVQPSAVQVGNAVQPIGFNPQLYQLGGLQTQPSVLQPSTVQTGSSGQSIGLQPNTFQSTDHQTQPSVLSDVLSHGVPPVSYELTTQTTAVNLWASQDARKKAGKFKLEVIKYADVSCSAYSIPKVKHTSTNTVQINKNIGTQADISLQQKSQGVQCPEGGNLDLVTFRMFKESSTQAEQMSSQATIQDSDPAKRSAMFVQDMGPMGNTLPAYEAWKADELFLQDLQRIQSYRKMYKPGQIKFDDVAIYFSKDEWECLTEEDKDLYMEMMVKNYRTLHSLGWTTVKPPLIRMIEQGEDLYAKYPEQFGNSKIPGLIRKDSVDMKNGISIEESYDLHKFSERLRNNIDEFLTFCMQQTEDLMSGATVNLSEYVSSETGPFCQAIMLPNQKPFIEERPFRCFRCERRFKRFCDVVSHQKFHAFENGFGCFQCTMTFKNVKALVKHELIHTGEKPFICSRCGKRFFTQQLLDTHLGVTLKKNPYVCAECGKRFAKKYTLRKHEMVHNRAKPFLCSICGKGFTQEDEFNDHQRIHMEEHIYSCEFCGKRFSSKPSFEKHRQEHTCTQVLPDIDPQSKQMLLLKQIQEGASVLPIKMELQS
ncbi:uncharacterized protein ACNLHF_018029 isoform 1-T2 [Anomaloglossus baeobatrachus]|uniref:uncharacterized protein LOC142311236 n=1 Tax=Anomaloglossus baeobatrachus TaxID=238106 RepID=UPI003F4FF215